MRGGRGRVGKGDLDLVFGYGHALHDGLDDGPAIFEGNDGKETQSESV